MTIAGITFAGMYNPMHMTNKVKFLVVFCCSEIVFLRRPNFDWFHFNLIV